MSDNPYAPPLAQSKPPPLITGITLGSPYGSYRDVTLVHRLVLVFLGLTALLASAQIYALIGLNKANHLPDDSPLYDEMESRYWNLSDQLDSIEIWLLLATVICWCVWKNLSCKNAWLFSSARPAAENFLNSHPTPGWAVGGYFIPILNFYKPYFAMTFISRQVEDKVYTGKIVGLWWLTFLVGENAGTLWLLVTGNGGMLGEETLFTEDLIFYNRTLMADYASNIVSCIFAAAVIRQMTVGQQRKAADLETNGVSIPTASIL